VISQLAAAVWGRHTVLYVYFQIVDSRHPDPRREHRVQRISGAGIDFGAAPVSASAAAHTRRPARFSNGVLLLASASIALVVGFNASLDRLIQLYIIGVFTSFTLSQAGWSITGPSCYAMASSRADGSNAPGRSTSSAPSSLRSCWSSCCITKVEHGAWIAILAMLVLFVLMKGIRRHYDLVAEELTANDSIRPALPARNHAIVLVSRVHLPTLRALAYARATGPHTLEAFVGGRRFRGGACAARRVGSGAESKSLCAS